MHGEAATQAAIDASGALFGRGGNLEDIDEETLESVLDGFKVVDENGEHVFPVSKPGVCVIDAAQAAGLLSPLPRHAAPASPAGAVSQQQPYRG